MHSDSLKGISTLNNMPDVVSATYVSKFVLTFHGVVLVFHCAEKIRRDGAANP